MSISTVQAVINGSTVNLTYDSTSGKYHAQVTAPSSSSYPETNHYFPVSVTATDSAGNSTTITTSDATLGNNLKLYVQEKVKPTVSITSPSNSAYIINSTPTITFTLLDNSNGQSSGFSGVNTSTCVIKIDGSTISGTPTFTATTGGYTGSLALSSALTDGSHTLSITVQDYDGNTSDAATSTFTVDTVAPTLTITNPSSQSTETNADTITVTGTTSDTTSTPVAITISLNGTDQGSVTVGAGGAFSKTVTLAQNQQNTIIITATDAAGKTTSVTRYVTHNNVAPVFTSVSIVPNPVDAGTTYDIYVEVE